MAATPAEAGNVPTRAVEPRDDAAGDGIARGHQDDRDRLRLRLDDSRRQGPDCYDDVGLQADQLLRARPCTIDVRAGPPNVHPHVEPSLGGKWLELLSEIAPGLKRAAIMFNPDTAAVSAFMPSFETAARSLKVAPITAAVHSDVEIETAIIALGREPGGGLVVVPDVFTIVHRAPIIAAAARNNVPAVYSSSLTARDGGLLSYGPGQADRIRCAAAYVDRILRGEKPGDLPVQLPTKFEMIVNLKTAKALGLAVPPSIMLRADEVIA
jgi:hypothetical protein